MLFQYIIENENVYQDRNIKPQSKEKSAKRTNSPKMSNKGDMSIKMNKRDHSTVQDKSKSLERNDNLNKVSSLHSITTNFQSVHSDSKIKLFDSTCNLDNIKLSSKKRFSLGKRSPKSRTPSPGQKKTSPRRNSSPITKQKNNLECKKRNKAESPLQKKLQDPNETWHGILSSKGNRSTVEEQSFNSKYGLEENKNYPFKIKEYKPKKLQTSPRIPRSKKSSKSLKADEVGDGSGCSFEKSNQFINTNKESSLEKGDSKQEPHSSTTEELAIKDIPKRYSRSRTSSRDPLMPLPHRSPQNKFSISKKKKEADETTSNISGMLSYVETSSLKNIPKSISDISNLIKAFLRNSIKNTQTTCTTYPSSTKAASAAVPSAATSTFPSSLCTTTTAPYCDYYNVPCEPRVNVTSTRRDENYYPYNHQQKHRRLYPGNQEHYQQDDDDDYYVDDYHLTNKIRDCNKVLRDSNNKKSLPISTKSIPRPVQSKQFNGCHCMKGKYDVIVGILNGSKECRVKDYDGEVMPRAKRIRGGVDSKVKGCPCMKLKLEKLFADCWIN
ncbi:hypothetical protein ACFFRR_010032 [Megaselia abdita]